MSSKIIHLGFIFIVVSGATCVIVQTKHGSIEGNVTDNCKVFLGLPYARPPERYKVKRIRIFTLRINSFKDVKMELTEILRLLSKYFMNMEKRRGALKMGRNSRN
ncbi:hypothetical protein KUTeg_017439 [Tegillarca granosa]|uniref:Uncharacterized protein n=1 Tax=Tegillarca granosa TaxID=220873 RepID=A0ABQ9EHF6_TEGGR|nr:hypothetical protein KUTeg_017439 [Tegillarca granosa]